MEDLAIAEKMAEPNNELLCRRQKQDVLQRVLKGSDLGEVWMREWITNDLWTVYCEMFEDLAARGARGFGVDISCVLYI